MDLHSVKLKFEAYVVDVNGCRTNIGAPVFSQAIHNLSKFKIFKFKYNSFCILFVGFS